MVFIDCCNLIIEEMLNYGITNWNAALCKTDGGLPWVLVDSLGAIIRQYVCDFAYDEASRIFQEQGLD